MCSQWGTIPNPTLKFSTPQHPQVPALGHDPGNKIKFCSICFLSFICENTYKVLYKYLWNWLCNWNLMIFDLTPSSPVWRWGENLTTFCFARHPLQFDMPHDHVKKKKFFWPARRPKVPPLGHDPDAGMKIQFNMLYIFHLWEDTQSLV